MRFFFCFVLLFCFCFCFCFFFLRLLEINVIQYNLFVQQKGAENWLGSRDETRLLSDRAG